MNAMIIENNKIAQTKNAAFSTLMANFFQFTFCIVFQNDHSVNWNTVIVDYPKNSLFAVQGNQFAFIPNVSQHTQK